MEILVLEASTTSAKAMVCDPATGASQVAVEPYAPNGGDESLRDADAVVKAVAAVGRRLSTGRDIAAIALASAWHGLLLTDRDHRPVTSLYSWANTEAASICQELRRDPELVSWFHDATGCMVNTTYPVFTVLLLRERGLAVPDLLVSDGASYMNRVLTGRAVQTRCLASASGMLNIHQREYDPEVLRLAGLRPEQLPELIWSDAALGLSQAGADLLGLPTGTPVLPANSDGGLNQIGAGALRPGVMTFSVGTSGALRLIADSPRGTKSPATWCYLSPRSWLSGAATAGCCNCIDWFRQQAQGGRLSYAELEAGHGPGDSAPVFLPFIFGERCPGWDDRRTGGFCGLLPEHDTAALYRAVQQGVLFNLYQCYQELVGLNGEPSRIKLSGGILNSTVWTQMCADIFGVEMEINEAQHGSLMGGAVLAMEHLGLIDDVKDYDPPAVRIVTPGEGASVYEARYQTYLEAYDQVNDRKEPE